MPTQKKEKKGKKVWDSVPNLSKMEMHKIAYDDVLHYQLDMENITGFDRDNLPLYNSPDDLLKAFICYLDYCSKASRVPNLAGFCVYDRVTKTSLRSYREKPEFADVFNYIQLLLEDAYIHEYPEKAADYLLDNMGMIPKKRAEDSTRNIFIYNNMKTEELHDALAKIQEERRALESGAGDD